MNTTQNISRIIVKIVRFCIFILWWILFFKSIAENINLILGYPQKNGSAIWAYEFLAISIIGTICIKQKDYSFFTYFIYWVMVFIASLLKLLHVSEIYDIGTHMIDFIFLSSHAPIWGITADIPILNNIWNEITLVMSGFFIMLIINKEILNMNQNKKEK